MSRVARVCTGYHSQLEQVSGSSPLVGSLFCLQIPRKLKISDMNMESVAAVGQQ